MPNTNIAGKSFHLEKVSVSFWRILTFLYFLPDHDHPNRFVPQLPFVLQFTDFNAFIECCPNLIFCYNKLDWFIETYGNNIIDGILFSIQVIKHFFTKENTAQA